MTPFVQVRYMWLSLAFLSAALLGFYDSCKKQALGGNAVIPVLFLNTLFCSLIFIPLIVLSYCTSALDGSVLKVGDYGGWEVQRWIVLKSAIVLSSWVLGYFGMKHLPLTIVGPINATRPVLVLVGAMLLFGEKLNYLQWTGVLLAIVSFFMLSRSGKKEGIDFEHNVWIYAVGGAAILGAASGLYDKFLMNPDGLALDKMAVQSWYNIYQCGMMGVMLMLIWYSEPEKDDEVPLEVVYHIHFHILECRRFCLSLRIVSAWRDDFHRLDGPPWQRHSQLPLRRPSIQGEEPQKQSCRPGIRSPGNGLPLSRFAVGELL